DSSQTQRIDFRDAGGTQVTVSCYSRTSGLAEAATLKTRGIHPMKYFIDTADVAEIREAASWGLIDGVTTNPSLMAKTGRPYHDVLKEICEIVDGPVSAEVVATEASAMIEEGEKLAKLHKNIVVKCPMIVEGLKPTHP